MIVPYEKEIVFNTKIKEICSISLEYEANVLDEDEIEKMHVKLIKSKLYKIENGVYRHDSLKTAYLIFSYLMDNE